MKKKITCLVMVLLVMCLSLFTGCSLVEVDSEKYYNAVIVEIKDENGKVVSTVTNRELISGYQSVGYYYEYNGFTKEEAVDKTLELLENRKVSIMAAEQKWGIDKDGTNLDPKEKTYLWEQTVNTLQQNLDSYLDEEEDEETEEENTTTSIAYEDFVPTAYLASDGNGNYEIKLVDPEDGVLDNYIPTVSEKDFNKEEDFNLILENFKENNQNGKNFDAYKKYLTQLKAAEKGQNLSTYTDDVFAREIKRIYTQCYENYVVEIYTEDLLKTNGVSSISVQDILDLYSSKVRSDYTQYVLEGDTGYDKNVQDAPKDVYYYLEGKENTTYFNVLNILFNENETEEGKYNLIVREDNGEGNYEEQSNQVLSKSEIYSFISSNITNVIANAQNSSDSDILYNTIKDCVFKYNQDPGMQKSNAVYTIGVDGEGNAVSNFVEAFNNAGLELYAQNKIGNIEIAESEYGIHVLIYTGVCENLFAGINESFVLTNDEVEDGEYTAIEVLDNTRVYPMLDKSYFELLYEELYVDNSSYIQQSNIDVLRAQYSFTSYKGRIPSALKD
ncbi:MAG: hypothetical protein IJY90_01975 [Clostridia bacterium]|nr:hypothetical protein [Clostridia bacterium]